MDVAIVGGTRTPHGRLLGALSDRSAVDLGATALEALVERSGLSPGGVDWVGLGNAIQAGVGQVPARQATLAAGLSDETPATTVNEASGSGLRAVALAADRIEAGRADLALAGGMESMSNAPYLVRDHRTGRRHGDDRLVDAMIHDSLWDLTYDAHMGTLTEGLVDRFDLTRESQDEYALESHRRAVEAVDSGVFEEEVVPVDGRAVDEGPRADTSMEALAGLSPSFDPEGTITPGNASDLSDGAGAVALASDDAVEERGLDPLARVVDYEVSYRDPRWFGVSVCAAVDGLLDRNGLRVDDVDHFELNEAFAAQMLVVMDRVGVPREKLNPLGGAVALGHPIGASGGILTTTLAHAMVREGHRRGVVGMSIGGGGGIAALLER